MEEANKTMNPSPTVPQSREAEEAAIGSVFIDPDTFTEMHFLKSQDFFIHRHGFIWDAFTRLSEKRAPIDLMTVSDELDKVGMLGECGGSAYLTGLINQVPSSLNAVNYAKIIEEHAIRRRMIDAGTKIVTMAYDETKEIQAMHEESNKVLTEALQSNSEEGHPLADALSKVYDRAFDNAQRRKDGDALNVGLTTGFTDLDALLLGIEDEESVIVAGRPGDGKTSFLLNIASHAALKLGKRVAIFSQEMSNEEVARRLVSTYAEIDSQKIKTGMMDSREWERFTNAIEVLENSQIFVSDATSLTPSKLRAKCLQLKRTSGLDLVIIDYLQLMNAGIKMENRTREIGYISRNVKMLNKELRCPIISAAQLSREVEKRTEKKPILSDLRDAGDLEQDANTVMFLYRPDKYEPKGDRANVTEVVVAKRRDGMTGNVELIYRPSFTKFANAKMTSFQPNKRDESRYAYAQSAAVGSED